MNINTTTSNLAYSGAGSSTSKQVGYIHSIDTFGTVDGPGIRMVVFMQGCQWRCQYCHNRDTWDLHAGDSMQVDDLMRMILDYRYYFDVSGGGLTVSGGEPILQSEFVKELFLACHEYGIHTCLDTNGFIEKYTPTINELVSETDLVLLDIKQMDNQRHIQITKISNKPTLQFAEHLASLNRPVWIRYVVLEGITSDLQSIQALGQFLEPMKNVERVELLPYHTLGKYKWAAMKQPYELEGAIPPTSKTLEAIHSILTGYGLDVRY